MAARERFLQRQFKNAALRLSRHAVVAILFTCFWSTFCPTAFAFPGPTITSLSPTSGPVGATVTITGTNFVSGEMAPIIASFNGTYSGVTKLSGTTLVSTVPAGATTGNVTVQTIDGTSNGVLFTVLPTPSITSLSPTSGVWGSSVTISGMNFGATQGSSTVTFNGTAATTFTSWSSTAIAATVPTGATTGDVVVTATGVPSNGVMFTVTEPVLTSISPTAISPGMQMTLNGTGFGAAQGSGSVILGTEANGTVVSWSNTRIVATVPAELEPGNAEVKQSGVTSNGIAFTVIAPTLTSISPTAISPSIQMTLTGTGFGSAQGNGSVILGPEATGTVVSWSNTKIVVTVPSELVPGNASVTQNGATSNGIAFTVVAPTLANISPSAISPAMQVTLTGTGFGSAQGNGSVALGPEATGTVVSWSNTQIVVTVPAQLEPGNASVTQNGATSNGIAFTVVPPTLSSISPTALSPGTQVTLTGTGFGSAQGNGSVILGPEATGTVVSWSSTKIVATVPAELVPGNAQVEQNGATSNGVAFTIVPPTLTSISPTAVDPGMQMTLTGTGFGTAQGNGIVTLGPESTGTVVSWASTKIIVTVPAGVVAGNASVTQNGATSNGIAFTIIQPTITSLSPTSGSAGTPVTITGTNFASSQGTSTVTFNGTPGAPTSWSATKIVVPAPAGATTGPVVVTVNGASSNGVTFTDTSAPTITSISPSSGKAGTSVTISGSLFGATQGSSTVTFNSQTANPTSWATGKIVVPAPTGVTTGDVVVTVGGAASNGILFVAAPIISSLSPTSGAVTAPVTITGTNFGPAPGSSTVTFNGTAATPTTWSNTSIVAPVPSGATTGSVVVTVSGTASNAITFTVTAAPVITSLSPTSGAAGQVVTITGTTFGSAQGTSTVTFNGTPGTPASWSATSIKVPVPAAATTGNVVVTVSGVASNGVSFTVLPTPDITNLSPSSGPVGTAVTITGTNFGATQGTSTLTFNGKTATPTSWSATTVQAAVPTSATTGPVVLTVNGVASNGVTFTVTATPIINSVSPPQGAVGTVVTIAGSNFGSTQGSSTVKFNGTTATPTSWSATSIVVPVPSGATTGPLVVTVGGVASNGITFTVLPTPTITSLSPTSGAVGASVTITGTNFGSSQGTSSVTFNGVGATPTSWAATKIVVPVPAGATTGPVIVTVNGVPSNGITFTVLPTPTITTVSPGAAGVGQTVTIAGTNFGSTKGSSTVTFNGTAGTPTTWSATQIVVPVPSGATSGNLVVTVGGIASNGVSFTVLPTPSITSLSPTSGSVGASVTINGSNFGPTEGSSSVTFNGVVAVPTSWTAAQVVAPVPAGASTGPVVVTVSGVPSNGVTFTVLSPTITSLSPTSGGIATAVTITGTNFGASQGTSTVKFNSTAATPVSWSGTSIVAPVPSGATTGNVVVTVGGVASNGISFTVTTAPGITSIAPTSGGIGTVVTITGSGFASTQGSSTVTFNGQTATPQSWNSAQIVAPVPTGGTNGPVLVTVNGQASNSQQFTTGLNTASVDPMADPNQITYGQSVTYSATVSGSGPVPTGSVSFSYSDPPQPLCTGALENGQTNCTSTGGILPILPGDYTINAQYSGDSNYMPSTGTASLSVSPGPTTTTISPVPASPVQEGYLYQFTVTVTPNVTTMGMLGPTGTGAVLDNGVADAGNPNPGTLDQGAPTSTASVQFNIYGGGAHTLTGQYNPDGDSPFAASTCCDYQVTVNQAATVTVSASYDPTMVYFSLENPVTVTMSATVTAPSGGDPTPTGTVSLTDNFDTDYGTCTLGGGACSLPFSSDLFPVPTDSQIDETFYYAMTANYSGDSNYAGASASPFTETVECDTYDVITDYYLYQDMYDSTDYYWYTYWQENQDTTTYNCQEVEITSNTEQINSGTDPCDYVDSDYYCDGYYEWEADLYWCDDFGQDDYEWTDWYIIDYCDDGGEIKGGK
jgi:carbon monoxide dehydrogenase subunit G